MMASCSEFELLLAQKLDDALLPEEESLLASHLETCLDCRRLSEELFFLQQTLSSLTTPPPPSLHTRIMEEIKAEGTAGLQKPAPLVRPVAFYRRFATTAAALVLLVSALAFGTRLMPNAPTEEPPSADTALVSLPSHEIQAPAQKNEAPTPPKETPAPQPKAEKPHVSAKSIPKSESFASIQSKSRSLTEQIPTAPSPELDDSLTNPRSEPPAAFLAGSAPSSELTQEEAEALLRVYLSDEGKPTTSLTFASRSEDGAFYQFLYTDDAGFAWKYTVSSLDGSVSCESAQDDQLSKNN